MNDKKKNPILLARFEPFHSFEELVNAVGNLFKEPSSSNIYLTVPFSFVEPFAKHMKEATLGVESLIDTHPEKFTSTIATRMLSERNVQFVLIGTANERKFHQNNPALLHEKLDRVLSSTITPIVCVGETWIEFCDGLSKEVIKKQLTELIGDLPKKTLKGLHIVYEAPWILETPWEANNEHLLKAYEQFNEVVNELSTSTTKFKLLYSVPAYSEDLKQIMENLPADGYLIGIFNGSAAETSRVCSL